MNDLERIDASLIALRRLWTTPPRIDDPAFGSVEMSTIWVADSLRRTPDQTVADLAGHMGVAHSTASRLIGRAERVGAVSRQPDPQDQRRVTVRLTPAGQMLAQTALHHRLAIVSGATHDFTVQERATFADLLTRFIYRKDPQ